jgi:hypothetical protein
VTIPVYRVHGQIFYVTARYIYAALLLLPLVMIIIIIIIIISSGTMALTGVSRLNTGPLPKLVRMRSGWLVYRPNTLIRIFLIQQPEPSVSEAGELEVRNRVREIYVKT